MKHIVSVCLCLLCATLILAALPTDAEASIYDDTLRLHILAASDSEEDQFTKLAVRDHVLHVYGEQLKSAEDLEDATARVSTLLPEIECEVNRFLKARGVSYTATVTLTEEWYDTRVYDAFTLPRGTYLSLRILLDGGNGQNWWCVMYPPMCLDLALSPCAAGYTDEEASLISSGGYSIKFKLLEVLSDLFG